MTIDKDQKATDELIDEAEQLIWALLDDRLEKADTVRLETLLKESEQVRDCYLECVQIHADLKGHFASDQPAPLNDPPPSPVLGSLGELRPDSGTLPPVLE